MEKSSINKTIEACKDFDGAILAIPSIDTVKNAENKIIKTNVKKNCKNNTILEKKRLKIKNIPKKTGGYGEHLEIKKTLKTILVKNVFMYQI